MRERGRRKRGDRRLRGRRQEVMREREINKWKKWLKSRLKEPENFKRKLLIYLITADKCKEGLSSRL